MLFLFIVILISALLTLNFILSSSKPDAEKLSIYECGFQTIYGQTRSQFNIHFYIVAMLFLIFDLEILLFLPIAICLYQVGVYGLTMAIIFFLILTIGFVYEIASGAIKLSNIKT
jgi:NADH-ubiquinone oxidoreductase chain 3